MDCEAELEWLTHGETVTNDAQVASLVREVAEGIPGVTDVSSTERTMGSEDYGEFMVKVPGCFFFVGSNNKEKELDFPHHHPRFDIDERALTIGAALMASTAARYVLPA